MTGKITLALAAFILAILSPTPSQARHHYQHYQQQYYYPHYRHHHHRAPQYWVDPNGSVVVAKSRRGSRHHAKRYAKRHHAKRVAAIRWNMVKVKTVQGFYLTVHPAYAHKFLRLFEILAQNNVEVPKSMVGCFSRGGHVGGSNHYIGAACDIQTGWNRTIPAMYHAGKWIKAAGLYDGCSFGDCGHVEAIRGTHNAKKLPNLYAAMEKFKSDESTANYQP